MAALRDLVVVFVVAVVYVLFRFNCSAVVAGEQVPRVHCEKFQPISNYR